MDTVELKVRKINQAIDANRFGRGGGVYCDMADGSRWRIIHAGNIQGKLHVYRVNDGAWVRPIAVYKEW